MQSLISMSSIYLLVELGGSCTTNFEPNSEIGSWTLYSNVSPVSIYKIESNLILLTSKIYCIILIITFILTMRILPFM